MSATATLSSVSTCPPYPKELADMAVPWDPEMVPQKVVIIQAQTFQAWVDAMLPAGNTLTPGMKRVIEKSDDVIKVGRWSLRRRVLPVYTLRYPGMLSYRSNPWWELSALSILHKGRRFGEVGFDGDVIIPVLVDQNNAPWMSITPSEVWSNRPGLRKAKGDVLIGGLGMGMAARMIRAKQGIGRVVVVERDPDVARVFGEIPGVEVVVEDFYAYATQHGSDFTAIIADIWQDYGGAAWDRRFQELKEKHPRVWGWGDYARLG